MIKPKQCQGCSLYSISSGFSRVEGECSNGVGILGEHLDHAGYLDGTPMPPQGQGGSLLENVFRLTRTSRKQFLIDNMVRCAPPNDFLDRRYEQSASSYCTGQHMSRFTNNTNLRVIVCVGTLPFKYASQLAGKKLSLSDCRGYVLHSPVFNVPIIGSYHPADIRRGKLAWTDYLVHDIRKAIEFAAGRYKNFVSPNNYKHNYILTPSIDDAKSFFYRVKDNANLSLSYDIETPNSGEAEEDERDELGGEPIISSQFSLGKGEGIYLPWEGNYIKVAQALLRTKNRKLGFNVWHFDNPKLESNGCVINGEVIDLMFKFHYLKPDLEMGLQKVASLCDFPFIWKHMANDFKLQRFYGVVDVDVLHWIEPKIEAVMKSMKIK